MACQCYNKINEDLHLCFGSWPFFPQSGAILFSMLLIRMQSALDQDAVKLLTAQHALDQDAVWIPFGDHPLKLERYRED